MNQKLDRNIIEYLLASLDSSLRGDADIDRLLGAYQNSEWQMLIEAYRIRTAHLLGEFANAMPFTAQMEMRRLFTSMMPY